MTHTKAAWQTSSQSDQQLAVLQDWDSSAVTGVGRERVGIFQVQHDLACSKGFGAHHPHHCHSPTPYPHPPLHHAHPLSHPDSPTSILLSVLWMFPEHCLGSRNLPIPYCGRVNKTYEGPGWEIRVPPLLFWDTQPLPTVLRAYISWERATRYGVNRKDTTSVLFGFLNSFIFVLFVCGSFSFWFCFVLR